MSAPRTCLHIFAVAAMVAGTFLSAGCSTVTLKQSTRQEYLERRQRSVLTTGTHSTGTQKTLIVTGLDEKHCSKDASRCLGVIGASTGIDEEMRLSALSELWLERALAASPNNETPELTDAALAAYLEAARYAYAYLFFSPRPPEQRAFEIRQAQVAEFYNYAVRRAVLSFFAGETATSGGWPRLRAGWVWKWPDSNVRFDCTPAIPAQLMPTEGLAFKGLRNAYVLDGLGAAFVAVAPQSASPPRSAARPWRRPEYVPLTALLVFPGDTLADVLSARQVQIVGRDPMEDAQVTLNRRSVPLAANYTAPYAVWLARSRFNRQSIFSLLGRGRGLNEPQVLLLRPFDPNRRTIVMIHGLASSPVGWINTANAMIGYDRDLRRDYQIWQVYYPTNVPIAVTRAKIQAALTETLDHFDPDRSTRASNDMVLIGHSMGGVIARLLVSSSQGELTDVVRMRSDLPKDERDALLMQLHPYLQFEPMPEFTRAIFLAAPHRGSPKADLTLAHWLSRLIRLPAELLEQNATLLEAMKHASPLGEPTRSPNSIDNLSVHNPFISRAAELPISARVAYHSIIGTYRQGGLPLEESSDGVVPYWSSHLKDAESEAVVPSWHDVQSKPEAMMEIRRILRLHQTRTQWGARASVSRACPQEGRGNGTSSSEERE